MSERNQLLCLLHHIAKTRFHIGTFLPCQESSVTIAQEQRLPLSIIR